MLSISIPSFDVLSIVAAILFIVTNLLGIFSVKHFQGHAQFHLDSFLELDPTFLKGLWETRNDEAALQLAFGFMNCVSWFFLTIPIIKVAWIQSSGGKNQIGIHIAIVMMTVTCSFTELMGRILQMGCSGASMWIATKFNLDNWTASYSQDMIGWRTLEIVNLVTSGMLLWVDAMEYLFLFGILSLIFVSVRENNTKPETFSMGWARYGAFLGMLCLADFFISLLRYKLWVRLSNICLYFSMLNRLFLIPIWLVYLARQLPSVEESFLNRCSGVAEMNQKRDKKRNLILEWADIDLTDRTESENSFVNS